MARGRIRYRKLRGGHRDDRTEAARSRSDGGHADEVISRPSLLGCLFCSWFAGVVAATPHRPGFLVRYRCVETLNLEWTAGTPGRSELAFGFVFAGPVVRGLCVAASSPYASAG